MISSEEVELYDRQIRIWGIEAQKRLRSSSILITGATGLSAEAAKNLALAGIGRIVLAIPENSKKRAQACFFPSSDPELYRAKVAELNPNIKVERATGEISDMIKGVDCVILANNESIETWIRVNEICRRENAKCFCAVQIGFYGFMLVDMIEYEYMLKNQTNKYVEKYSELKSVLGMNADVFKSRTRKKAVNRAGKLYSAILHVLQVKSGTGERPTPSYETDQDLVEELLQAWGTESPAAASVLGGLLAQEALKAITRDSAPLKNVVVLNGISTEAVVIDLC